MYQVSLVSAMYRAEAYLSAYVRNVLEFMRGAERLHVPVQILIRITDPTSKELELLEALRPYAWCDIAEVARRGAYAAWNEGVLAAEGEYVGFWNVDDTRFPQAVAEAVSLFNAGADVVYFPFVIRRYLKFFNFSLPVYRKYIGGPALDFNERKFRRGMVCGPHFMFRKSLYYDIGPFDEQFKFASDFDWCVRAVEHTQKFKRGKELSGSFRVDGTGLSSGSKPWRNAENNVILTRHHQLDLVVPTSAVETQKYRPQEFLFREQWHPLSALSAILK